MAIHCPVLPFLLPSCRHRPRQQRSWKTLNHQNVEADHLHGQFLIKLEKRWNILKWTGISSTPQNNLSQFQDFWRRLDDILMIQFIMIRSGVRNRNWNMLCTSLLTSHPQNLSSALTASCSTSLAVTGTCKWFGDSTNLNSSHGFPSLPMQPQPLLLLDVKCQSYEAAKTQCSWDEPLWTDSVLAASFETRVSPTLVLMLPIQSMHLPSTC